MAPSKPSFASLLEIAQVGRRLVLAGRLQIAVTADKVILRPDDDVMIVLVAVVMGRPHGSRQRALARGEHNGRIKGARLLTMRADQPAM
jgi:hypothetical protein